MACSELQDMSTKILLPSFTELRDSIMPNTQQKNYRLDNLEEGSTYEIRLSYPAITPADFYMRILGNCKNEHGLRTYLLNISAKATGVSAAKNIEKEVVTYNLAMESLYFGFLFYNVYKIVIAIVAVLSLGYFVIIPHVKQFIKTKIA
ncbi:hypothetical protein RO3G_13478 [Rhizopus delemar RA 99-880]|uniref:Uncharacterized protein n=1 Tax=Rhizopus delemar (strain RA 99-880 / ATCC MYA-4621 / FGSC 9543 / NRRL 43880) TaxID=246409 RepID=I1CJY7_RHIO9|nr:hypothetical protein RO3G_13478 [Rhizopus delemar RA 99-880]|eukprot:EIE88767.1 hypothetical protein RO3G_13478 [Rhizopus delemar RA 99-880]